MRRSLPTTAALLGSSLALAFVVVDGPLESGAGPMVGIGHLLLTAVTIVGALVGAARWSLGLGLGLTVVSAALAIAHPVGPAWVVLVGLTALAAGGLIATGLRGTIRLRPRADGPPARATALPLALLGVPLVVGVVQPGGVDAVDWLVVALSAAIAVWYSQALPGSLWVARFGSPALVGVSAVAVDVPAALPVMAVFIGISALAWTTDARIAVQPLAEPGKAISIPAELAPRDVLDAAGLDDRGRPMEDR